MDPDPYALLGVEPSAAQPAIRAAWLAQLRRHHPDIAAGPDSEARTRALNEAYATLGDPVRRARLDGERLRRSRDLELARARVLAPPPRPPQRRRRPLLRAVILTILIAGPALWFGLLGPLQLDPPDEFTPLIPIRPLDPLLDPAPGPAPVARATVTEPALVIDPPPPPLDPDPLFGVPAEVLGRYRAGGVDALVEGSRECAIRAAEARDPWPAQDRCAAFDIAALLIAGAGDPYLAATPDIAPIRYAALTDNARIVANRLRQIRDLVTPSTRALLTPTR